MKKIKITFITTLDHNIGDDFVREGIIYILKKVSNIQNVEFEYSFINKHKPFELWPFAKKIKSNKIKKVIDFILSFFNFDNLINQSDLIIQSGAPVYWCQPVRKNHCSQNEWFKPILKYKAFKNNIPFINIAAGSCQSYKSDHKSFCNMCKSYTKKLFIKSIATTVRDNVSYNLHKSLNLDATKIIPCPSIFAIDNFGVKKKKSSYIALNLMEYGGHYDLESNVKKEFLKNIFIEFYNTISKLYEVVFVCHDINELNYVKSINPDFDCFYERNDYKAYLNFYSEALYGVLNRVHGAFILKSMDIPVFLIGNDSRAQMCDLINVEHSFVNDITLEKLISFHKKSLSYKTDKDFKKIKSLAHAQYLGLISQIIKKINV